MGSFRNFIVFLILIVYNISAYLTQSITHKGFYLHRCPKWAVLPMMQILCGWACWVSENRPFCLN